jgi:hypothetical protein
MGRRSPAQARLLGLWTAGCLAVLLLVGVLRLGDLSVEWPVFGVPLLWASVALRRRGSRPHAAAAARGAGPRGAQGAAGTPEG